MKNLFRFILVAVLLAFAAVYGVGGFQILVLGDTSYYLLAAGMLTASTVGILLKRSWSVAVFAALIVYSLLWTIYDTGLDFWQIATRLIWLSLLGLVLLLPSFTPGRSGWEKTARSSLGLSLLLVIGTTAFSYYLLMTNQTTSFESERGADAQARPAATYESTDWIAYGNSRAGTRYSPLDEVTPTNIDRLELAWTYRTGIGGTFKNTPLQRDNKLFVCGAGNRLIGLDAEDGKELWRFDPQVDEEILNFLPYFTTTCRGVSYFEAPAGYSGECPRRLLMGTTDARLMAVDADTGKPCSSFGDKGELDLTYQLGDMKQDWYYFVTSAPAIVSGNAVVGGWVADNVEINEPSGVIRAFNAISGEFAWAWDMGRPNDPGEPKGDAIYTRGTPNVWSIFSVDEERNLVFAPLGNETPDFFGGQRQDASEKYASAVVAIHGDSGELAWSFQTVHHDIWDLDVPSQPTLIDLPGPDGNVVPALLQPTKRGELFLLNRETGIPIAEVEERPVPQAGGVPEDFVSATQPYSSMPNLLREELDVGQMWGAFPTDQIWCRKAFLESRYEGEFTPLGTDYSLIYPSYAGGYNWGSVSIDEGRLIMLGHVKTLINRIRLVPRDQIEEGVFIMPQLGTPYGAETGFFLSPLGLPCNEPPLGRILAIDLVSQKLLWHRQIGSAGFGVPLTSGFTVTAGGLAFHAGISDGKLRALDTATGETLWQHQLPHAGQATPIVYLSPESKTQTLIVTLPEGNIAPGSVIHVEPQDQGGYVFAFRLGE